MRSFLFFIIVILLNCPLFVDAQADQEYSYRKLDSLLNSIKIKDKIRQSRISEFMLKSKSFEKNEIYSLVQKGYELFDIQNQQAVFRKSFNSDAAIAMGVNTINEGGSLGLNLTGSNLNLGIWDGGLIRTTHREFEGRIKYFDTAASSVFSNHATGVACTMLGTGLSPSSKGMAPKATGIAYNFINDTQEMVEAQMLRDIYLSNHSYGLITGWNDGQWFGDASISDQEDWRFGFYDSNASTWDDIAYTAPYYLIVKSAGNDRGESGSGSFPADGPYDCVAGASTAKNVLIVGAVEKSNSGYDDPAAIRMSSFSGWGPTDDGRIKPDLVSIGVNINTAASQSNEDYQVTNGTSFSSPAACGALSLVQQLYQQINNVYMKSATLKALAIHTVKQTGEEGPDYRFGWGLLNVQNAAEFIQLKNNSDKQILESSLGNGEIMKIKISPKNGSSGRFTIVWTDPAGNPVSSSLDPENLMIINDLDIRIEDETGATFFPYILDPSIPSATAKKGDNFRDNVEQIYISDFEDRNYNIVISHKGSLSTSSQDFSIIIDYESTTNALTNLYWINNTGMWFDSGQWSASSGGASVGITPDAENRIIIDDNSITENSIISLTENASVGAISLFSSKELTIDLNGFALNVLGDLSLSSENLTIKNGTINLSNDTEGEFQINLNNTITENLNITIPESNVASWTAQNSNISFDELNFFSGILIFNEVKGTFNSLKAGSSDNPDESHFLLNGNTTIEVSESLDIEYLSEFKDSRNTIMNFGIGADTTTVNLGSKNILGKIYFKNAFGSLSASSISIPHLSILESNLSFDGDFEIKKMDCQGPSLLILNSVKKLSVTESLELNSDIDGIISFRSNNNEISNLTIDYRDRLCFDYLNISNVNLLGESSVSIGLNSLLTNSNGWAQVECLSLLFSNFEVNYPCSEALSEFEDYSLGNVEAWEWRINNNLVSQSEKYFHTFENTGMYEIGLTVYDDLNNSSAFAKEIEIQENSLDPNHIIISTNTILASFKLADAYQWYKNNEIVDGATSRTYVYNGEIADYFVVTFKGECNRKSEELKLLTSTDEIESKNEILNIYPNPVQNTLNIDFIDLSNVPYEINIISIDGKDVFKSGIIDNVKSIIVDFSEETSGLYYLISKSRNGISRIKFVKI